LRRRLSSSSPSSRVRIAFMCSRTCRSVNESSHFLQTVRLVKYRLFVSRIPSQCIGEMGQDNG
jgi:hypothetical protein